MITIFFDASVLFAALYSNTGASYRLAQLVQQHRLLGIVSLTVIEEVEQHLDKFPTPPALHDFIQDYQFVVRDHIQPAEIAPWTHLVDKTDAHVVAGAISVAADYLVTLDKKHLNHPKVKEKITAVAIVSPQECLAIVESSC